MIKYKIFPLPYRFQTVVGVAFATREVVFESQKKQVQQLSINPIEDWQIDVAGDVDGYIKWVAIRARLFFLMKRIVHGWYALAVINSR